MILKHTVTIVLLQLLLFSTASRAQEQGPWWTWPTIDGNWFGYRHTLADYGLVFSGATVVDLQGNASGGQSRGFGAADASLLAMDMDLERLAGITGSLLHAEFVGQCRREPVREEHRQCSPSGDRICSARILSWVGVCPAELVQWQAHFAS
jgi:carbohydrate-selective porin OprB